MCLRNYVLLVLLSRYLPANTVQQYRDAARLAGTDWFQVHPLLPELEDLVEYKVPNESQTYLKRGFWALHEGRLTHDIY